MLARFRTRTLGFRANLRWFDFQGASDNFCLFCPDKPVKEDEVHFLFHCKAYKHIREKCDLFSASDSHGQRLSLIDILTSLDDYIILSLAKYVAEAISVRNKLLTIARSTHD